MCFFGDGATNIGAFHEALNLAAVWSLPVVFVCENNLYMEYTPIEAVTAVANPAADRASAYGLERILVDGNDPDVMLQTARSRRSARARAGDGPSLVEAVTYRHGGHSRADPAKYRPGSRGAGMACTRSRCLPIARSWRPTGSPAAILDSIDAEADREIDEATEMAKASPPPLVASIERDVWSDGGSAWRI